MKCETPNVQAHDLEYIADDDVVEIFDKRTRPALS